MSVGYPEEHVMILSAAFLNQTGYQKRALPPDEIIPILAADTASRTGRKKLQKWNPGLTGSKVIS